MVERRRRNGPGSAASELVDRGDKDEGTRSHADIRRLGAACPFRRASRQGEADHRRCPCDTRSRTVDDRGDSQPRAGALAIRSGDVVAATTRLPALVAANRRPVVREASCRYAVATTKRRRTPSAAKRRRAVTAERREDQRTGHSRRRRAARERSRHPSA